MRKLLLTIFLLLATPALAQNVKTVTITNGVPTAGSGTVSTLDNLIGTAGTPGTNVLSVQGISGGFALPASQSGTWNVTNISGTVSLPTGASTAANQTTINTSIGTGNTSLATIATNSALPIPDCAATPCTNKIGNVYQQQQYPQSTTPVTSSTTGTTAAITATLAGTVGKTTYLCGFSVRANATAAATGNIAVTGTISGTLNFTQWTAPLASGIGITEPNLGPYCIPASATNTSIVVTTAAPGAGGVISVAAWGYQQ